MSASTQTECPSSLTDKTVFKPIRCGSNGYIHQEMLTFKPGGFCKRHYHKVTTERYVVISGKGEIFLHDQCITTSVGLCVDIPMNAIHQIKNTGKIDLVILSTKNQPVSVQDFHEFP
jgi:mannose-6-phosphate isomerase-like protein (cupin superfamily)